MLARARRRWQAWMAHPVLWLELRRLRRFWSVRWVLDRRITAIDANLPPVAPDTSETAPSEATADTPDTAEASASDAMGENNEEPEGT